jgi:hypothetical protein
MLINNIFIYIVNFYSNHFFFVTFFLINFVIFYKYKYNGDFKNNLKKKFLSIFENRSIVSDLNFFLDFLKKKFLKIKNFIILFLKK